MENEPFSKETSEVMDRVKMWAVLLQKVKMEEADKEIVNFEVDNGNTFDLEIDNGKKVHTNVDYEKKVDTKVDSENYQGNDIKLLKKVSVDDDNQFMTRRKQIGRVQKWPHVVGGPTILRARHRTAKKAKVLLDFGQSKGWVRKVKKFERQRKQGGEQRANLKQEVAKAKVLAWLQAIEVEDWKSQMLQVLERAV